MNQLKPLRAPLPVLILFTALILACASDDSSSYSFHGDSSCSGTPPTNTDTYTPTYGTSSGTSGPTLPSYIPELDSSKPPEYPKTADVSLYYTEPVPPDSTTFFTDLCTKHNVQNFRGGANDPFYDDYWSILGTTALLVSESVTRYNSDGSSTKYAHGLAFATFDTSKRTPFVNTEVSTGDRYTLAMGYMRDGNAYGPWWYNHIELARQGLENRCHSISEYQNGKANGETRWYDTDGYMTQRAFCSNGEFHGTLTIWGDEVTTQKEYVNGTAYGSFQEWEDGCLVRRGQVYGTQFYGKYERWDPSSTSYRYTVRYRNLGPSRGWVTGYNDKGVLLSQAWSEDGSDNGTYIEYAAEGHRKWQGTRTAGQNNGLFRRYTADGFNDFDSEYVNGVQTGRVKWYFRSGKLWQEGAFVAGANNGKFTTYREDGTVSEVVEYSLGVRHGAQIQYDTAGNETMHDIYDNGTWVRSELAPSWPDPVVVKDAAGNPVTRTYGRWRIDASSEMPPMSVGMAMVWSKELGGCVAFGGRNDGDDFVDEEFFSQTWLRKGGQWQQVFKETAGPSARDRVAMAYDSARGVVVLFGGRDSDWAALGDTWELSTQGWRKLAPANSPPARYAAQMAYDTARGVCVLFGGTTGETPIGGTWEWNGTDWKEAAPVSPPAARWGHAMAYDEDRSVVVLHGGVTTEGAMSDALSYDGKRWTSSRIENLGGAVTWHGMVYDNDGKRMVLLAADYSYDETDRGFKALVPDFGWFEDFEWASFDLRQGPELRWEYAACYDRTAREVVVFGGRDDFSEPFRQTLVLTDETAADRAADQREFIDTELAAPGWTWIDNGEFAADDLTYNALVHDPVRSVTVMFGGQRGGKAVSETREFSEGKWTLKQPGVSPPARNNPICWFDETRGRVMMHGGWVPNAEGTGSSLLGDLWEWDGTEWTRLRESTPGMPGAIYTWAYDAKRGVVVAYGGATAQDARALYEFNGTSWKQTEAGEPAEKLSGGKWGYDPAAGKCLFFGAYHAAEFTPITRAWYWDGKYWEEAKFEITADADGSMYRMFADPTRKVFWRVSPGTISRLEKGQWTHWNAPNGLAVHVCQLWVDQKTGKIYVHSTYSNQFRNDTLEFDPEQGEQK